MSPLLFLDVRLVFIAEISDCAENGVGKRGPKTAHGGIFYRCPQFFQELHVAFAPPSFSDSCQDLQQRIAAVAARAALPAGLVIGELNEELGDIDHAGVFIHHNHSAGTHHGAHFLQALVVNREIDVAIRDAAPRRTARLHRLELFAARDAAADVVDDLAQCDPHGNLDQITWSPSPLQRPGRYDFTMSVLDSLQPHDRATSRFACFAR